MSKVILLLTIWFLLSVPLGILVGKALARGPATSLKTTTADIPAAREAAVYSHLVVESDVVPPTPAQVPTQMQTAASAPARHSLFVEPLVESGSRRE